MDGVPSPDTYQNAQKRILFILKDANFRISKEKQASGNYSNEPYDQRIELRDSPDEWWRKVSNWCVPMLKPELDWEKVKQEDICNSLSYFAFMQLKKNAGGGSVVTNKLSEIAKEDKDEIKKQISIYQPEFIVCCGVGEIVNKNVFGNNSHLEYTKNGVGYWKVLINNTPSYIIGYCHPSARFGKRVEGAVALGLSEAISFISNKS